MSQSDIQFPEMDAHHRRLVRDIMSTSLVTLPDTASLIAASEKMEHAGVSSILIRGAAGMDGILTEKDITRMLSLGMPGDTLVAEVMVKQIISVSENTEVHDAYHKMMVHGIRHLVVEDEQGHIQGVISEADFRKKLGVERFVGRLTVSQSMSTHFLMLPDTSSIQEAAKTMLSQRMTTVLIMQGARLAGIVTERDMVHAFRQGLGSAPVTQIMSHPVHTISGSSSLLDAANRMQADGIRRLVVLDDFSGAVTGLLDEHDLVKQLEDDYIQMLQQLVMKQARTLNEDKFRKLVNQLPQRIIVKDTELNYVSCNERYAEDLGVSVDGVAGKNDFDFFPADLAEKYRADDRLVMARRAEHSFEERYILNGELRWLHTLKAPVFDAEGQVTGVLVTFTDITESKLASEALRRRSWVLQALRHCDHALVHADSETEMLQQVCDAITSENMYPLAWVAKAGPAPECKVEVLAAAGRAMGYLQGLEVYWSDIPLGNGPTGRSIRLGKTIVNNQAASAENFLPWLKQAQRYAIASSISLPLRTHGQVTGALVVYAEEADAFGKDEILLLEEFAANLAYGVESRRTRQAYQAALLQKAEQSRKLEKALEDALAVVAAVLEQRDPYTAGHQNHVAALAQQIGKELKLDEDRLRGLYLAGLVHDLGKIQVPAEILNKPGRLNREEYALVKLHPEVGYHLLKKIDFPWPIADVIRQHHEYLDGSGYPKGISGDAILPEARIITVADIVESMSSDRPYRASLGLQAAMTEIQRLSDQHKLDSDVVAACIRVLQRGEYVPQILTLD
ncbi:HD domain-containing phosphohydrolase [Leeia oryzae]|uniref:HD domain-containing phosphohydrolase n=1 Tax=Leeia oryzae TaxID=356662 RepID=UPI000374EFBF|nr:HD domain-containing phosphohydrolase [Leeia oryzae]